MQRNRHWPERSDPRAWLSRTPAQQPSCQPTSQGARTARMQPCPLRQSPAGAATAQAPWSIRIGKQRTSPPYDSSRCSKFQPAQLDPAQTIRKRPPDLRYASIERKGMKDIMIRPLHRATLPMPCRQKHDAVPVLGVRSLDIGVRLIGMAIRNRWIAPASCPSPRSRLEHLAFGASRCPTTSFAVTAAPHG